jgi:hypothetical protein
MPIGGPTTGMQAGAVAPVERLMVLDAGLVDRDRTWLATEQDKLAHFMLTHRIPRQELSSLTFQVEDAEAVRYFPDKQPVGFNPAARRTPSCIW